MSRFRHTKTAQIAAFFLTLLVLVAFALSSLVPVGFMPEFGDDGSYELVICSGMGTKTITVQGDSPKADTDHAEKPSVCAYQTFAAAQSVDPVPAVYLPAPVIALGQSFFPSDIAPSQTAYNSLTARGPPAV